MKSDLKDPQKGHMGSRNEATGSTYMITPDKFGLMHSQAQVEIGPRKGHQRPIKEWTSEDL